jgi:hypothetical protein
MSINCDLIADLSLLLDVSCEKFKSNKLKNDYYYYNFLSIKFQLKDSVVNIMFSEKHISNIVLNFDILFCRVFFSYRSSFFYFDSKIITYYSMVDLVYDEDRCDICLIKMVDCCHSMLYNFGCSTRTRTRILKYLYKGFFDKFLSHFVLNRM